MVHVVPCQYVVQVHTPGLEHQPPLAHAGEQTAKEEDSKFEYEYWYLLKKNLRVAHREPVRVDGHVHVLPT